MAKKNLVPQEPGEEEIPQGAVDEAAETEIQAADAATDVDDVQTQAEEEIQRLHNLITELRGEIARRDAILQKMGVTLQSYAESEEAKLPDQSEIDPTSITAPVLSKDGWVMPALKEG